MSLAMAMPSTGGETDNLLPHCTVKKPRGHYTARLPTRLPILRFRRHPINRRSQKWLHPAATILAAGGKTAAQGTEGMAMPESGR
jgi:hypothetical protein